MLKGQRIIAILGIFLTVAFCYLALSAFISIVGLYRVGIVDVLLIVVGMVASTGFLISLHVTKLLLRIKILKETYFFALFVVSFSVLSHLFLNLLLKTDLQLELIVAFWIVLGTPISCIFSGYSGRAILERIGRLGFRQGMTFLTVFLLVSIPIIEVLPNYIQVHSKGRILYREIAFESGNDTATVQGQIHNLDFTAEIPMHPDTVFVAKQIVNVTNQTPESLGLRFNLKAINGNLSKVRQLMLFLTLEDGNEICPFSVIDEEVVFRQQDFILKGNSKISVGAASLAQSTSLTGVVVVCFSIQPGEATHILNVEILVNSL